MPTVIDALIVTLGLDPSGFKKGQAETGEALKKTRDDAGATAKELQAQGQKAAEFFTTIKNEALTAFAAILGSRDVISFAEKATQSLAAMGVAAANIGTSVPELSTIRNAVEAFGGNADEATASFTALSQAVAGARSGLKPPSGELVTFFGLIGANPFKDDPLEVLKKFNAYAQTVDRQRAIFVGKLGGLDMSTINLAIEPTAKFLDRINEAQKRSLTGKQAADMKELQTTFEDLRQSIYKTSIEVLDDWVPAINKALSATDAWIQANPELAKSLEKAGVAIEGIAAAGGAIALFVGGFSAATSAVLGLNAALITFYGLIKAPSLPDELNSTTPRDTSPDSAAMKWWKEFATKHLGFKFPDTPSTPSAPPGTGPLQNPRNWFHDNFGVGAGGGGATPGNTPPTAPNPSTTPGGGGLYGPGNTPPTGPRSPISGLSDIDKLVSLGWSREQAAGIVANLNAESYGRIDAVGDGGAAYGLAQWHGDRQAAFAALFGHDIRQSTRDEQLAFVDWELRHTESRAGQALAAARSAAEAASVVSRLYERPAGGSAEAARRASLADALSLSAGTGARGGSSSTSQTTIGAVNVYTKATDAKGIAQSIRNELLVAQANTSYA